MLHKPLGQARRVLITLDAVGGVWRYALDLARGLQNFGATCLLVGFGPEPDASQCAESTNLEMIWLDEPLDWMVSDGSMLDPGGRKLVECAREWDAHLLHLNLPSQAAGLPNGFPVVVASHSCLPTWWQTVQGTALPVDWAWQQERNRQGLQRANAVVVPSASHAAALRRVYQKLPPLHVVYNGMDIAPIGVPKEGLILAVGRWWDSGKNGAVLDLAAASTPWPVVMAGPLRSPNGECAVFRNVQTPGPLPHDEVLVLMRRASIFAAPSRYEPFGLAVAEAAICGAALVLADIPTFRELWDGAALFVGLDDPDGWSNAFAAVAADDKLRRLLAGEALARAREFTVSRQVARLHELHSDVVSSA